MKKNIAQWKPWPVVLLAIDPGKECGWASFLDGRLLRSEHMRTTMGEVGHVCRGAEFMADKYDRRLVVAIESHSVWKGMSAKSREGLHRNAGIWVQATDELRTRRPATKIVRVNVSTWRAAFGLRSVEGKDAQLVLASLLAGCEISDHNEAEAILIGYYACRSELVGKVLGKREHASAK